MSMAEIEKVAQARADLEDLLRDYEEMVEELEVMQNSVNAVHEVLKEAFREQGCPLIITGQKRAKLQESYELRRRPDPPPTAIDAVFERVPYSYVKRWIEPLPKIRKKSRS
jgi:hypothetical protein